MKLEDLQPQAGSKHRKRRIGRGIAAGQGASGGFGMRGQKSRSGRPTRPGFEGGQIPIYRRLPKLKHFTIVNPKHFTVVNIDSLSQLSAGTEVTLDSLMDAGIVTQNDGFLRILGRGELTVALTVHAHSFSSGAKAKIEAAGGTCVAFAT
jgi:large subunit ribosomal protein L15